MEESIYLEDLLPKLQWNEQNCIRQIGKSDIEPPNFKEIVENWYSQLYEIVEKTPPENFVKSINVFQIANWEIKSVQYNYCTQYDCPDYVGIVIYK